jgi:hypothetical protein
MLARSKGDGASHDPDWSLGQQIRSAVAPEASSISSGLSIIAAAAASRSSGNRCDQASGGA